MSACVCVCTWVRVFSTEEDPRQLCLDRRDGVFSGQLLLLPVWNKLGIFTESHKGAGAAAPPPSPTPSPPLPPFGSTDK